MVKTISGILRLKELWRSRLAGVILRDSGCRTSVGGFDLDMPVAFLCCCIAILCCCIAMCQLVKCLACVV